MWYRAECLEPDCKWFALWTTEAAAQADSVWHVYFMHEETWLERIGDRLPLGVATWPADLGDKVR
jgi:hypothetical protein